MQNIYIYVDLYYVYVEITTSGGAICSGLDDDMCVRIFCHRFFFLFFLSLNNKKEASFFSLYWKNTVRYLPFKLLKANMSFKK